MYRKHLARPGVIVDPSCGWSATIAGVPRAAACEDTWTAPVSGALGMPAGADGASLTATTACRSRRAAVRRGRVRPRSRYRWLAAAAGRPVPSSLRTDQRPPPYGVVRAARQPKPGPQRWGRAAQHRYVAWQSRDGGHGMPLPCLQFSPPGRRRVCADSRDQVLRQHPGEKVTVRGAAFLQTLADQRTGCHRRIQAHDPGNGTSGDRTRDGRAAP